MFWLTNEWGKMASEIRVDPAMFFSRFYIAAGNCVVGMKVEKGLYGGYCAYKHHLEVLMMEIKCLINLLAGSRRAVIYEIRGEK